MRMEVGGILVALPDVVEEELVLKDALLEHRLRRHHRGLKGEETTRKKIEEVSHRLWALAQIMHGRGATMYHHFGEPPRVQDDNVGEAGLAEVHERTQLVQELHRTNQLLLQKAKESQV